MNALLAALLLALPAASRAACPDAATPETLLEAADDPDLLHYATCLELAESRRGLCEGFAGGPRRPARGRPHTVVGADGKSRNETPYGVCVSLAPAYRLLQQLVDGAPEKDMLADMKLLLYGEKISAEDAVRTYADAYKRRTLEGSPHPELARVGFFTHVLGAKACASVASAGLRKECLHKAAALEALRARDASLCLSDDLMCRTLVAGAAECRGVGAKIFERLCGRPPKPPLKPAGV